MTYTKARKVGRFYDALTVNMRTILGDSPPQVVKHAFELWRGQVKNCSRWSPNKISEAVFVISKHANDYQEMIVQRGGRKTSDERVIALFLMYCTITNKISLADAARISQNQAAAARLQQQATLLSRPTKPLPANFRYDANKVCFICSITFLDLISQRRLLFFLLSAFRLPTLTVRLVYATGLSCLSSNPTNCDARRMPTTPSFRGGWICLIIAGLERSPVESSIHSSSTHARARR